MNYPYSTKPPSPHRRRRGWSDESTIVIFYYLVALLEPVHDTNIWSVPLAWELAGIAAVAAEEEAERWRV